MTSPGTALKPREQRLRPPNWIFRRGPLGALALPLTVLLLATAGCGAQASHANHPGASAPPASGAGNPRAHPLPATPAAQDRGAGGPGMTSAPVLMYHVIAPPPAGAPFPGLYVDPDQFAAQMRALARAGYHAVTLDQLRAYWRHGVALPAGKPVVITFDNGYNSQATQALPVLRALNWPAVLNIQLTGLPPSQGGLTEPQVGAMLASGWELDTQGLSHADLVTLGPTALHAQVAAVRITLQHRYHAPVNWFCYPSGHYNSTVIDAVKAAGYVGSTTTIPGWGHPTQDSYRLERLRVLRGITASGLLDFIAQTRDAPAPPPAYGS